ncbi:hypothetical protein [Streptomyces sp. NPDC000405]|uniref:hypothetical protein n=1 Tax=Streptomyces sp. NPDC000405 TaxID=3161033 RepID=UPI00398CA287
MRMFSRTLTAGLVVAATALTGTATAVAADTPPTAVEDFEYPQADKIFQERGIKLKSGDGHITLVACDSQTGLIEIFAQGMSKVDKVGGGKYCFRVTGKGGYLNLEVPRVYGASGNDYDVSVNMITADEEKPFKLKKNAWTPVGKSADDQNREFTLLKITATK